MILCSFVCIVGVVVVMILVLVSVFVGGCVVYVDLCLDIVVVFVCGMY